MKRVITGILLALVGCYIVFLAPPLIFQLFALLVGVTCFAEYAGLVKAHGISRPGLFGLVAGTATLLIPEHLLGLMLALAAVFALAYALREPDLRAVLPRVAAEIFGAIYTFMPWHYASMLRARSIHWLFVALALNWSGDSVAYYIGRAFGRHKLAPVVSPNKSWEGSMASAAGSIVFAVVYMSYFQPQVASWKIAAIIFVANVAGQLGDLAESAIKRGAGVKDSGNILPGHGGVLDRLDSSMFSVPVVYALSLLV